MILNVRKAVEIKEVHMCVRVRLAINSALTANHAIVRPCYILCYHSAFSRSN